MRRRGHTLLLVMLVLAAFGTLGLSLASRQSIGIQGRRPDGARRQALWLARSALQSGVRGDRRLGTQFGRGEVTVASRGAERVATATVGGFTATVRTDAAGGWSESVAAAQR